MTALHAACLKGVWYDHTLDTSDDSTSLVREHDQKMMFKVDSDAKLFNGDGTKLGKFRLDRSGYWEYITNAGSVTTTGNKELIKAEMKVFKDLLKV